MVESGAPPKKRRGPPATGKGEPVLVRLQPDLLEAVDRYIAEERPGISRAEALRSGFREWALAKGLLKA